LKARANAGPPSAGAWSPDGKQIAYIAPVYHDQADIYLVARDGGHPRRVTNRRGMKTGLQWMPDGTLVFTEVRVFTIGPEDATVYRISPDGKKMTRITDSRNLSWTSGGTFGALMAQLVIDNLKAGNAERRKEQARGRRSGRRGPRR
jgi:Tol biopolymer transport system component